MTNKGFIYILTNPSFPDYVKIGYAHDVEKRLQQLNQSECIPFAFRVYALYEVEHVLADKQIHKLLDSLNPDLRSVDKFAGKERVREFYAISAEEAYSLLECIAVISGTQSRLRKTTPTGEALEDEAVAKELEEISYTRRENFNFAKCGILFDTLFDEAGFLTLACVKGFLHGAGTQFLHRGDVAATFIRPTPDHAAALVCVNHAVNPGAFNAGHNSVQKTGDGGC